MKMLSIQDIVGKTAVQRRRIRECLQKTNSESGWHPEDASLYDGLKAADAYEVKQTLDSLSLAEVLVKGSSVMGADDLVAAKVYDTLVYAAKKFDLAPLISASMVSEWKGSDLTVPVTVDGTYVPQATSAAGRANDVNAVYTYATLAPVTYTAPILCGNDMIEDCSFGLVQRLVENAGKACAEKSSELAVSVLIAAPDGDGTLNEASASLESLAESDIAESCWENGADNFVSNTLLLSNIGWNFSLWKGYAAENADYYGVPLVYRLREPAAGFDMVLHGLDTKLYDSTVMNDEDGSESGTFDYSIVFDRNNALLTGRKRWLEIKDYANPIEDISGAIVSFRQDSVTLYKDAICLITGS